MDIHLDREGEPHWLSRAVICTCELDRTAYRAHRALAGGATSDRMLPTYTPIAKLCPLHAAAPRMFDMLERIAKASNGAERWDAVDIAREFVLNMKDARGICTCEPCSQCGGDPVVCARCGRCTRHEGGHVEGCSGCKAKA